MSPDVLANALLDAYALRAKCAVNPRTHSFIAAQGEFRGMCDGLAVAGVVQSSLQLQHDVMKAYALQPATRHEKVEHLLAALGWTQDPERQKRERHLMHLLCGRLNFTLVHGLPESGWTITQSERPNAVLSIETDRGRFLVRIEQEN